MRNKNILIVSFVISILFISCSKYEEGPQLSLVPKKNRIVGNWELFEFVPNDTIIPLNPIKYIELKKDFNALTNRENSVFEFKKNNAEWYFNYNKEELWLNYEYNNTEEHYGAREDYMIRDSTGLSIDYITTQQFYILKLKSTELWIKGYFDIIYKYKKV